MASIRVRAGLWVWERATAGFVDLQIRTGRLCFNRCRLYIRGAPIREFILTAGGEGDLALHALGAVRRCWQVPAKGSTRRILVIDRSFDIDADRPRLPLLIHIIHPDNPLCRRSQAVNP